MKAAAMLLPEKLHFADEEQAVEIVRELPVPASGAAVFTDLHQKIDPYHMICDFMVKLSQNALVDAGENIAGDELFRFQLIKACRKSKLLLDGATELVEHITVLA